MPANPIEFMRRLVDDTLQRVGNRVQIEDAAGTSITAANAFPVQVPGGVNVTPTADPLPVTLETAAGAATGIPANPVSVDLPHDPLPTTLEDAAGVPIGVAGNPIIVEDTGGGMSFDDITGALVAIDIVHHEIHIGDHFTVAYKSLDNAPIADDGTILYFFSVTTAYCHLVIEAACGGDAEVELRENAIAAEQPAGTAMTPNNNNRSSATAATATVLRDAGVTNAGTLIDNAFMPGGTGGNSIGQDWGSRIEWVLDLATVYLVRLTNRAGNAQPASLRLLWYEEAP